MEVTILNACFLLIASLVTADTPSPGDKASTPRPLYEINREISSLCQRDSQSKSDQDRAAAAYEMTVLYREILADPRLTTSPTLKEYKARLWSRLTRIKKDVQAKTQRASKSKSAVSTDDELLASAENIELQAIGRSMADQFALVGMSQGGPAAVFSLPGAAGGGMGPPDYGPALVDLIQRTIQPDFWDVNGGPGTIVYYKPLMCLVVRATSEVHHQLGGAVGAVRDAGK